jgi:hypothetical protein
MTWTKPWTAVVPWTKIDPKEQMYEYMCHEDNFDIVHLLTGARIAERTRVEPAASKEVDAMRTTILFAAIVTIGLVVGSRTLSAHHAFASEFDANRHVVFTGPFPR